jgi:6-phosphofructokinase 1
VVLGHLQRGGTPTSYDRVLATRLGGKAVECLINQEFGKMVAHQPPDVVTVPLEDIVGRQKLVPLDFDLIRTARALGISFGDAPGGACV